MRYSRTESTYILGAFDSGDTVTIDIYDLDTDTKVVDGASCTEIGSTGVFKYLFTQTITGKKEYLWIMTNGSYSRMGKIVLGGWLDDVKDKVDANLDATVSSRATQTSVDNLSNQLSTHDTDIKSRLSDIEGTGFTPSDDSLSAISDKIDNVSTDTTELKDKLKKHDAKLDAYKWMG